MSPQELQQISRATNRLLDLEPLFHREIRKTPEYQRAICRKHYFDITSRKIQDGCDFLKSPEDFSLVLVLSYDLTPSAEEKVSVPRINLALLDQNPTLVKRIDALVYVLDPHHEIFGDLRITPESLWDLNLEGSRLQGRFCYAY